MDTMQHGNIMQHTLSQKNTKQKYKAYFFKFKIKAKTVRTGLKPYSFSRSLTRLLTHSLTHFIEFISGAGDWIWNFPNFRQEPYTLSLATFIFGPIQQSPLLCVE